MSRVAIYIEPAGDYVRVCAPDFPDVREVVGFTEDSALHEFLVALRYKARDLRSRGFRLRRATKTLPNAAGRLTWVTV